MEWRKHGPELSGDMPMDFLPCSNGEFAPGPPTKAQRLLMHLQDEEGERLRRKLGMSRREFVRSAAAFGVGIWAIQQLALGPDRARGDHSTGAECTLHHPGSQLNNLPGEFIIDVQNHHLDTEDQTWRASQPVFDAFALGFFAQSGCGDPNHIDCYGRFHYIKEIYVDSSTNVGVLTGIPSSLGMHPLPPPKAAETAHTVQEFAGTERAFFQPFLFPNEGYAGRVERGKAYGVEQTLDNMERYIDEYGSGGMNVLRGWKLYTPYGEAPGVSGYYMDDPEGRAVIEKTRELGVPLICSHKGLASPPFDIRTASCRDVGVVGKEHPDVTFVIYHSGFNEEQVGPYPGDVAADSSRQGVDGLIKSLRENGWSATQQGGNSPNVYAELGATWRIVSNRFDTVGEDGRQERIQAAHLLGKLIHHVGPSRVVWGTDSLWHGSPQSQIVGLRLFPLAEETEARRILAEEYGLPHGLDGDVDDPSINALDGAGYADGQGHPERSIRNGIFGRNAAGPYKIDVDVAHGEISCDQLQEVRDDYLLARATEREVRPTASNEVYGPRTRREFLAGAWPNRPWLP